MFHDQLLILSNLESHFEAKLINLQCNFQKMFRDYPMSYSREYSNEDSWWFVSPRLWIYALNNCLVQLDYYLMLFHFHLNCRELTLFLPHLSSLMLTKYQVLIYPTCLTLYPPELMTTWRRKTMKWLLWHPGLNNIHHSRSRNAWCVTRGTGRITWHSKCHVM